MDSEWKVQVVAEVERSGGVEWRREGGGAVVLVVWLSCTSETWDLFFVAFLFSHSVLLCCVLCVVCCVMLCRLGVVVVSDSAVVLPH